ncbi:MAG: hypothetical protein JNJ88_05055 [Planctomycetes bacterium]|nr:hypothetical protein [Planctomycetota bacterium]
MDRRLIHCLAIMSLLSFLGCSGTTKDLPAKLTDLSVKVEAEHLTNLMGSQNYTRHSIRAVISNAKGADVERNDVRLEVNGMPMRFRVGQGNYYDRHPYYLIDGDDGFELKPATEHRFVLTLPDGARHDVGVLRSPAALSPDQFDFAKKAPTSGPVTIAWKDLAEAAQLQIGRSHLCRGDDGQIVIEGTGTYDTDALRRTIGPGWFRSRSDRFEVPADFLVSSEKRKLLSLQADIFVTTEGRPSSAISKASTLQATRRIQLEMEFAKVE